MRAYTDTTGSYDLDEVVAITPHYVRSGARRGTPAATGKRATLHLSSGAVLVTAGDYDTVAGKWNGTAAAPPTPAVPAPIAAPAPAAQKPTAAQAKA